jgi:hypothetical protein
MTAEQLRAFRAAVRAGDLLSLVVAMEAFGLVPHPYDAARRNRDAEMRLRLAIARRRIRAL